MDEIFCKLAEILQSVLPKNWDKALLYSELDENSYDISFYCRLKKNNVYMQCYELEKYGILEKSIDSAIEGIYNILRQLWLESKSQETIWTNCTFSLTSDGKFNFDYDYTNLVDCAYEYREQWKKKYLK
ncbi:MAG: DUF600 family protein [Treponema sp.]|nr:DUF600 family protein [Treponema sp.]